ncbi:uncharacterized protein LOC143032305 isoform X2 [Oratosquilla oratoria]|uniref:uncharacterized protein LOC143032305 isoform X2 n=1 Tax=Oratosquilla oratoria TaxID=337810 RepID=UPI003F772880
MEKLKVPRGKKSKKEKSANRKPSGTVKGDERVSNYDKVMTTGKYSDIERDNEIEATEIPLQEQNLLKERDLHPHATSVVSRLKKNLNYIENGMYQKGQESPELQTKLGSSLSLGKKDGGTTKEYFVNKLSKDGKSSQSSTSNWTDPGSAHSSGILLPPQPEQVLAQDRFVPEILHERTESVSNHSPGRLPKAVSPKSHTRNKARTSCQNNNGSKKSQEDNEKTSTSVEGKTSEIMVSSAREVMKVKPKAWWWAMAEGWVDVWNWVDDLITNFSPPPSTNCSHTKLKSPSTSLYHRALLLRVGKGRSGVPKGRVRRWHRGTRGIP